MNKFELIQSKFPNIKIDENKLIVDFNICEILHFLKTTPELSFDMLLTIVAIDNIDYFELIYPIASTYLNDKIFVYTKTKGYTNTVIDIYPSAYYDECEIFDLFGIKFEGNNKVKRLLMPESWHGHPLKKDYQMNDERLIWNE